MFVRMTTDPAPRPTSLGELGIASESNPRVSLNEFTYKKGTEIYGACFMFNKTGQPLAPRP
jgi:CRP/FNR family nitrogen fixation transcriptional regulator